MKLVLFIFYVLAVTSCTVHKRATDKDDLSLKIANQYGLKNFDKVKKMGYTFNVRRDTFSTSRSWIWDIKNNIVSYSIPGRFLTYKRDTIQSNEIKKIDATFINDQYWLLFPFHLAWDSGTTKTIIPESKGVLTGAPLTRLTIQYDNKNGYTPGDAYDLYVNENNMISEWAFRKGGAVTPTLAAKWSEVKEINGMKMTTLFKNDSTRFEISFTGITVQ